MEKKFKINGREQDWYYLTNAELVSLIKSADTSAEDKEFLTEKLINKFEYENCPRNSDEDNHNVFARQFSNFVNGKCYDKKKVAELMAKDHRYLVQEMFGIFWEYLKVLDNDYQNGRYDGRNQWCCYSSNKIVEYLKEIKLM